MLKLFSSPLQWVHDFGTVFIDKNAIKRIKYFLRPGFSLTIAHKWIDFNLQWIFLYTDISWVLYNNCFHFVSSSIKKFFTTCFENIALLLKQSVYTLRDNSYSIAVFWKVLETIYLSETFSEEKKKEKLYYEQWVFSALIRLPRNRRRHLSKYPFTDHRPTFDVQDRNGEYFESPCTILKKMQFGLFWFGLVLYL